MYPWSHLLRAAAFFSAMERPGKLGQPRSLATRSSTHPTWPFHTAKCNAFMPISSVEHGFPPVSRSSRRYLRAELEDDERPSPMTFGGVGLLASSSSRNAHARTDEEDSRPAAGTPRLLARPSLAASSRTWSLRGRGVAVARPGTGFREGLRRLRAAAAPHTGRDLGPAAARIDARRPARVEAAPTRSVGAAPNSSPFGQPHKTASAAARMDR